MEKREKLVALYLEGFPNDSVAFAEHFVNLVPLDNIVAVDKSGSIIDCDKDASSPVSVAYIVYKDAKIFGNNKSLPYLSALSTKEQMRGRGLIGVAILHAFNIMYERGDILTVLNPFNNNYYKRFGYCDITFSQKSIINGGKSFVAKEVATNDLDNLDDGILNELLSIEEKQLHGIPNCLVANEKRIRWLLKNYSIDDAICRIIYDIDEAVAFSISYSNTIEYYAEVRKGIIDEVESLKGCEYDLMIEQQAIDENTLKEREKNSFIQARIINAEKAILEYAFDQSICGSFKLNIKDSFFSKNNKTVYVNISNGSATLMLSDKARDMKAEDYIEYSYNIDELCYIMFAGGDIFSKSNCFFKDKY